MSGVVQVEPLTTARALRGPFDYVRPDGVGVGALLEVPFGRQTLRAVVTGVAESSPHRLATPRRVLPESLPPDLVDLAMWMAREYCSTPSRALTLLLPPAGTRAKAQLWAAATEAGRSPGADVRLTDNQRALLASLPRFAGADLGSLRRLEARGLVSIAPRDRRRAPAHATVGSRREPPVLNAEQEAAVHAISTAAPGERLLLHGVTGSGKTEVYLRAAEHTLRAGGTVIVLVPEIGLTPQMISRFVDRFGDTVAVLHSGLSAGERYDEWRRLRDGHARICVGPRSAVLAPLRDVGLIVVDEEHDSSYKHEGDPRYDARLVAERRADAAGGVLVAGSATPRPESVALLRRIRLARRADGAPLPPVEIVDMRSTPAGTLLHRRTHDALVDARKAIVLLNRRGWSNFLTCRSCGHTWECPQCDVTLVLHRAAGAMACHHCGHREPIPRGCPECRSVSLARHGTGTERLEHDLGRIAPVLRLDAGVANPGAVLQEFGRAQRAILVGTQVVAKGHDFPDVDLGVVVDADGTLRFPDFRAEERTFSLVTQLAGRAGRGSRGGRVLVQTLDPDAPSIAHAARHDSDGFLAGELERRRVLRYPPFASLIRVVCSAPEAPVAQAAAMAVRDALAAAGGPGEGAMVLGPASLFRLRGRERYQLVVKGPDRPAAITAVGAAVAQVAAERRHRGANLSVDVDPQ
ncbi:primosomal protein N' [Paraconexibacter sp.]|uniref:replication restart helicase PriA n=1 Tax=Paraconexibacter sp. TaxID=2949640 RepID=UPI0035680FEB